MNIIVTGGAGFLGKFVVNELAKRGHGKPFVPRSYKYDLREVIDVQKMFNAAIEYFDGLPDCVIHLAGHVGGIGLNMKHPGTLYIDNLLMNTHTMDMAKRFDIKKFVMIGTCCSYPKNTEVPFKETDIWSGYPEPTNAAYALAKKAGLVQAQSYREEFGFNAIYLIPANLFGPGDNFDPEFSHVVPALIRKFDEAKKFNLPEITIWGTGNATREFLYAGDAAEAIVIAAELYNDKEPVNIGTGVSITIKELVNIIAEIVEFKGDILWDTTKPNGQPDRKLDVSRAEKVLNWKSKTSLREGLKRTIDWYQNNANKEILCQ